jgi:2,5-diketo-D-gluconate reductase A
VSFDQPVQVLADGSRIPRLGLGVWQVPNGRECVDAVRWALEAGYRHIDTAQAYGNEESVGRGLRESGVPREDVFLTTKFHPRRRDPAAEAARSLERLGVDRLDLYIVHWPEGGATRAWPGMEQALELGHTRSIGVSNYSVEQLDEVLAQATHPPLLNQVQFSPFEYRRGLLEACTERSGGTDAPRPRCSCAGACRGGRS